VDFKEKVINIYPDARCDMNKRRLYPSEFEFRIYTIEKRTYIEYNFRVNNEYAIIHKLLGVAPDENNAWKNAWNNIEKLMLEKLEQ
jgi:hypothetical protein